MEESRRWTRRQRVAGLAALVLVGAALAWIWLSDPDRTGTTLRDETGAVVSWSFGESRTDERAPRGGDSPFWLDVDGRGLRAHWGDVICGEHAVIVVRGTAAALAIDAGARRPVFPSGCDDAGVGFTLRLALTDAPRSVSLSYRGFFGDRHEAVWPAPATAADPG